MLQAYGRSHPPPASASNYLRLQMRSLPFLGRTTFRTIAGAKRPHATCAIWRCSRDARFSGAKRSRHHVRRQLALELGLSEPLITWHAARDNIAEIVNFLALVGGSLGKMAFDIILMSSNEIGEVSEPFFSHRGASSTMPQKRNPISSETVLATAKILRANAGLALDAMVCDFERASGPWHLEWAVIPDSFVLTCGALHQTNFALAGLFVNESAMARNLASTRGLIVGEAVMMGLAPSIGRRHAHDVVYEACRRSVDTGRPLVDILLETHVLIDQVGEAEVRRLCDPTQYLGASGMMVDAVVARASV
jgi:3-carboxy-cis,cis-muconate cycloisomerase